MINIWSVTQTLESIGSLTDGEIKKAMPFAVIACSEITERLKKPEYEEEPAVLMACAALTIYRYTLSKSSGEEDFSSFKAGDITVSRSAAASAENAVRLRDEAMASAAGFLTDIDFMFGTVEV